jgi:exodeoxyribonuclease VII large subunit
VETFSTASRMESDPDRQNADLARVCLTVSQLNRAVSGSLQREFGTQRVRGEIASMTRAASGHWYFSLKDASAQVRCVMFRGRNALVDFVPREGDEVEVLASVALYEPRGEFQLTVESLRRFGAGRLWEEFLRLRQRLAAEGLFDAGVKRQLPQVPQRVGVVTSLQAAALRDVLTTLRRRAPYLAIVIYPVPVQGAEAGAQIAAMLATASRRAEVQVLLLVRGGGSIEDLWAFNDERVARAIRASALPVIVGVGHESDFTIADFAADLRAATPTAAAELVAPEQQGLLRELGLRLRALARAGARAAGERAQRLDYALRILASPRAPLRGLEARIADLRGRCALHAREPVRHARTQAASLARALARARPDTAALRAQLQDLARRMQTAHQRSVQARTNRLAHLERALAHLNVQGVLDRGFAILRDPRGRPLTDATTLVVGARVQAQLARGSADLLVEGTRPNDL